MFYFIWLEIFFKIKERLLYYLQNMCYCKNSLKPSLINDLQNKSYWALDEDLLNVRLTLKWFP